MDLAWMDGGGQGGACPKVTREGGPGGWQEQRKDSVVLMSHGGRACVNVMVVCFSSDPVFVARMLVNEIQMIKSIDFAKQEENRKQVRAG